MSSSDRIVLTQLVKGAFAIIPDVLRVQRGAVTLVTTNKTTKESIGAIVQRHAAKSPQRCAIRFHEQSWTYSEFNDWANRCAFVFAGAGIQQGLSVALIMENAPEVLAAVTGVVKLGGIAGMINHNQRGDVLAHSLGLTKASVVLVDESCRAGLETTDFHPEKDKQRLYFWSGTGKTPKGYHNFRDACSKASTRNPLQTTKIEAGAPAFYIFTSGTTGLPKASVMTHLRWLKGMAGLGQMSLRLEPDDIFYCALPLYHNNALTVSWGAVLGAGCTLALGRKFSASRFWDEIRSYDATAFCYIGEICRYLLNQRPSAEDKNHNVRVIVGNGLRPEIWAEFENRFNIGRISEFYGASEGNLAFSNAFGMRCTAGFCPLPFAIVKFDPETETPERNAKGFMNKVESGGTGLLISEITTRTPFDGYTDKKASESKLLRNVFKKGDVYFNTGDLVRDQGFRHIQFIDRVGDTFRWKGENVATTEVEAAVAAAEGIDQATVYGVTVPATDGRAGMATITLKPDAEFDGKKLAQFLTAQLPMYAVPLFIRIKTEIELTATFKFKKVELKREGYNLELTGADPIYVLLDKNQGYTALTSDEAAAISAGKIRF